MGDIPQFLVVLNSSDRPLVGKKWPIASLPAVITIGRDPACNLEIRSDAVSRRHARLERRADGWHVVDEGSTSGTYVNEARVMDFVVKRDDKVRVGDTILSIIELIVSTEYHREGPDGLTGLAKKRDLLARLDAAMQSGARALAVIRFDVDKLRLINSDRGHEVGDRILAEIGARLRASLRPGEYAGRLSADDFVVVLPAIGLPAATARATEIRAQLLAIAPVSAGVAAVAPHHRDGDELIYDAEKDLVARRRL